MATKTKKSATAAIEELIEVTLRTRKDAKRAKELRENAKQEAVALYKTKEWPIGKDMPFGKGTIRLYEEEVVTWEKNHQIKDALIDCYIAQLEHIEWLEQQVKKTREELKMTAHNLKLAHPDSDSIKQVLRFQIR